LLIPVSVDLRSFLLDFSLPCHHPPFGGVTLEVLFQPFGRTGARFKAGAGQAQVGKLECPRRAMLEK